MLVLNLRLLVLNLRLLVLMIILRGRSAGVTFGMEVGLVQVGEVRLGVWKTVVVRKNVAFLESLQGLVIVFNGRNGRYWNTHGYGIRLRYWNGSVDVNGYGVRLRHWNRPINGDRYWNRFVNDYGIRLWHWNGFGYCNWNSDGVRNGHRLRYGIRLWNADGLRHRVRLWNAVWNRQIRVAVSG